MGILSVGGLGLYTPCEYPLYALNTGGFNLPLTPTIHYLYHTVHPYLLILYTIVFNIIIPYSPLSLSCVDTDLLYPPHPTYLYHYCLRGNLGPLATPVRRRLPCTPTDPEPFLTYLYCFMFPYLELPQFVARLVPTSDSPRPTRFSPCNHSPHL